MPTETMTPKERWLAVLQRKTPDRMPMDYWGTDETMEKLMRHLGCADPGMSFARCTLIAWLGWVRNTSGRRSMTTTTCSDVVIATSIMKAAPTANVFLTRWPTTRQSMRSRRNYTWPSADWLDYSVIPGQIEGKEMYPIQGGGSEPFLIYAQLRGMEQAYMDLLVNPEMVHYCLDKLFDLAYENTQRIYEQLPGQILISYVAEDFGSQQSLLFSPETIRDVFIPRMKRMIDLAHEAGAYVFHHSDGAIRPIMPDMIAAGIDVLNPIQWRCRGHGARRARSATSAAR